ncbi:alpha/beta fold hydrolase [Marinoscillum pacificum]|uniref:alpha/beta fold hydrolase n=1 Tax=Marinoscillum pacificum TaxID=392723 RepID=UPI0021583744|nr:alpha/beta hydrolase [Marinoscillum pacificum]
MNQELFYEKHGLGEEILILFHGFGQTNEVLYPWHEELLERFTIFNFDLYYHGKSSRPDKPLTINQWKSDFESFLSEERIQNFYIGAFSLGGRFALKTYEIYPSKCNGIILVAPDGVYENFWYRLAVSKLGNGLFKYFMLHPSSFNKLLHLIDQLGLATSQMIRFAQKELSVKENRKRVYRSWTYFRPLQPNLQTINQLIEKHATPIDFILGSKDHLVPVEEIKSKINPSSSVQHHILPLKHHQLINGAKTLIPSLLKGNNL